MNAYLAGAISAAICGSFFFGLMFAVGCVEYTHNVIITDYRGITHEYPLLKADPMSAYFEITVLNKGRFEDGRPYLTAASSGGHVFTPYYPLTEKHFQEFRIGHKYVIERDMWNSDIIPLTEIEKPTEYQYGCDPYLTQRGIVPPYCNHMEITKSSIITSEKFSVNGTCIETKVE